MLVAKFVGMRDREDIFHIQPAVVMLKAGLRVVKDLALQVGDINGQIEHRAHALGNKQRLVIAALPLSSLVQGDRDDAIDMAQRMIDLFELLRCHLTEPEANFAVVMVLQGMNQRPGASPFLEEERGGGMLEGYLPREQIFDGIIGDQMEARKRQIAETMQAHMLFARDEQTAATKA